MEVCHQAQESSGRLQFVGHLVRSLHKHFSKKYYFFTGGEGGVAVIFGVMRFSFVVLTLFSYGLLLFQGLEILCIKFGLC